MASNNLLKKVKQKVEDLLTQYQKGEVSIEVLTNAIEDAEYQQRRAKLTQEERNAEDRREEALVQRSEEMHQPFSEDLELAYIPNNNGDNSTTRGAPAPEHNTNSTGGSRKKKCPTGKKINPKTGRCIKIKLPPKKKKCPVGKKVNPKTGRCIKRVTSKKQAVLIKAVKSLKKGNLGKHGYKNINSLTIKNRKKALNKAINEMGAPKIFRKIGLLKTLHKSKANNRKFQKLFTKLMLPYKRQFDAGKLSNEKQIDIMCKAMAETILLGWKGLTDSGELVEYSVDKAYEYLSMDGADEFRDLITGYAQDAETFREENLEQDVKN